VQNSSEANGWQEIFFLDELAFRRGLSGVLGKPPYAA